VITFHTASNAVMVAAQERGKMAIAYHSDMRKVAPDAQLMAVTHEWGAYYTQRVSDVQKGQWRTGNVWAGLKEGMIRVGDFGPKLPAKVRDEIVKLQQDIAQGKRHPFQGPIADNEGKPILAIGQKLSDVQILNMNYGVAGVAAGRMTQSNVAGYVAGFPIPEVLQGLNAFTLGMRSVNPKAQVKVIWLNSWFDPAKERDAAFALFNQSVDVISFHTASNAVMVAAQERGKMAIAYHSDMRKVAPDAQLMAVTHEWGAYYTQRVSDVQKGQWRTGNVWAGLKEGMIRVGDFGPKLPAKVRDEIVKLQQDISQGKRHPFQGPIADNEGKPIVAIGQKLSDVQILNMNYGVAGVVGKINP
jgi:basic membrane lipoprotein Med (substrate-binding protein (PBP1-ABC) superfamily)